MASTPAVSDHVRPADTTDAPVDPGATDAPVEPGVYRVVGASSESVTLLRVGAPDGRRVHTGDVVSVAHDDLGAFEPAENPDGNRPVTAALTDAVDGFVWGIRAFLDGLAARPLASLAAAVLLVAGHQGDRVVPGPDAVFTAASLVGGLS